jgi:predicted 3-demethylubiquinone-9 3-methyltransferase (glyoxalase superfamily)
MKKFLATLTLLFAFALPGFAQGQVRLSAEDQKKFDKHYSKWVNDTRKNDRDDIAKDVHEMQEIMAKYNIPANVPYDQIASTGSGVRLYQSRLSADDQREFDKYYTKWVNDTRKNDRDDVAKDVGRMQEIMARNNIPANVPFEQIASTGYPGNGYPATAYPANSQWQSRLSPDDQRDFDRYYSKWVDDARQNDRDAVSRDAGYMQEIMARNNIPASVPFGQIASSAGYSSGSSPAYVQRLSVNDQREFDHYYAEWLEHTRKNDQDDVAKDVARMQEIMARNNIPWNVPFDRIGSPDAASRH